MREVADRKGIQYIRECLKCVICTIKPQIHLCDFPTFNMTGGLKWLWNPDLLCHASEAWQLIWKVEVSTCPPAVCTLATELLGNGHDCKSSSPVLPLLEGEASWLEFLSSNHILERRIRGLAVESPIWPVYMALKPMTTLIVSMCAFFYCIWKYISYTLFFFSFFKVKKSKVHQSQKNVQWLPL